MKGTSGKRGSRKAPSTLSGFTAVLENIHEQNRATLEAVQSLERRMIERMDDLERRLTLRIEALEIAVRKNSEDIRKNSEDIRKNSEDIAELQRRVDELAAVVKGKPSDEELRQLEKRVAVIEERLGITPPA